MCACVVADSNSPALEPQSGSVAKRKAGSSSDEDGQAMSKVPRSDRQAYACTGAQAVQEPASAAPGVLFASLNKDYRFEFHETAAADAVVVSSIPACATACGSTLPTDLQTRNVPTSPSCGGVSTPARPPTARANTPAAEMSDSEGERRPAATRDPFLFTGDEETHSKVRPFAFPTPPSTPPACACSLVVAEGLPAPWTQHAFRFTHDEKKVLQAMYAKDPTTPSRTEGTRLAAEFTRVRSGCEEQFKAHT